jgi:negative regulator of sigma E activity
MMEKVFRFAESHEKVDRFVSTVGSSALAASAVAAVSLVVAFFIR